MMLYGGLMLVILLLQVVFAFIFVKNLDIPLILSGLLGIYLVLCAYSAIGLFMSTPDFLPDRGSGRYTGDTYLLEFCRRTLAGYSCRTGDYLVAVFVGTGQNVYGRTDMQ